MLERLMTEPLKVYIAWGSNLGDREATVNQALERLRKIPSLELLRSSRSYETEPWGMKSGNSFLNGVWEFAATLNPQKLLALLQTIEAGLGRNHQAEAKLKASGQAQYLDRTIDLDLLLYGNQQINTDNLVLPHPRMGERNFVLIPLQELLPGGIVHGSSVPIEELIEQNKLQGQVVTVYESG